MLRMQNVKYRIQGDQKKRIILYNAVVRILFLQPHFAYEEEKI